MYADVSDFLTKNYNIMPGLPGILSNKSSEYGVPKSVRHNVDVVDFDMRPAVDAGFFVASGLA
jgi:hypothetical protein